MARPASISMMLYGRPAHRAQVLHRDPTQASMESRPGELNAPGGLPSGPTGGNNDQEPARVAGRVATDILTAKERPDEIRARANLDGHARASFRGSAAEQHANAGASAFCGRQHPVFF